MSRLQFLIRLVTQLPSWVAIAGGWQALGRSAFKVLQAEGLRGFLIRLTRLVGRQALTPPPWPARIAVDVQRFSDDNISRIAAQLEFAFCKAPKVSIIIPVHNQILLTLECLAAIQRHPQQTSYEIIIVDDASTDATASLLAQAHGITMLRNASNQGYLESCNHALAHAKGELVYFLNNDTQVQAQWLDPLVQRMLVSPRTALVGSTLLFPDGRLQESGCMLCPPVDPTSGCLIGELIGMGDSPLNPDFCQAREVEYCSGASLLVRRALLTQLGGLDRRYVPAYFEDADLAYAVRATGWIVQVEPESKVVHHLSASIQSTSLGKTALIRRNSSLFMDKWGDAWRQWRHIRTLAIYLPQFHPIPENDAWWGAGFTEWTNVRKATPNFKGHIQPHAPTHLGYYDLRNPTVRSQQAELALAHGIDAFCYYYYWFGGHRLLNGPLDDMLASGQPVMQFCVCWANENWTRTWDGQDSHVLIAQRHSPEDDIAFIESLFPAMRDPRYLCVNGKPLLLVYKAALLPDARATAQRWRAHCQLHGVGEIYLACVHNDANPALNMNPKDIDFDAAVEFPPSGKGVPSSAPTQILNPNFKGRFYSYPDTARNFLRTRLPPYPLMRTVMPAWDNTARRQDAGHIFLDSSPHAYGQWLAEAAHWTAQFRLGSERLIFINAWNEWAEGNHLEPDEHHNMAYLEATRDQLARYRP